MRRELDAFSSPKGKPLYKKAQAKLIVKLLESIDRKLTAEISSGTDEAKSYLAYDYLLSAVINYNLEQFSTAQERLSHAKELADPQKMGACYYIEALLCFQRGEERKGTELLHNIVNQEPKAVIPYILLAQTAAKNGNYNEAFHVLESGMKNSKEEKCVMNWMAGNCLYNMERYNEAIPYYRTALRNMTINEYEAIYKLCIAKCYRKTGDYKEGEYWLEDAVSEVKGNKEMISELRRQYLE